jgi:hypothetical protein
LFVQVENRLAIHGCVAVFVEVARQPLAPVTRPDDDAAHLHRVQVFHQRSRSDGRYVALEPPDSILCLPVVGKRVRYRIDYR